MRRRYTNRSAHNRPRRALRKYGRSDFSGAPPRAPQRRRQMTRHRLQARHRSWPRTILLIRSGTFSYHLRRPPSATASALAAAGAYGPASVTPGRAGDRAVVTSHRVANRRAGTFIHQVLRHETVMRHGARREQTTDL